MADERTQRRLAAILAADVVGYARLMEQDETDTFERLRAHRKELLEPEIEQHRGRVFKLVGDGLLAEFASVVDAVECAAVLQRGMAKRNSGLPDGCRIDIRIGLHVGDVIVEDGDRHGDAVNIAARLQQLAEPGGICVSRSVLDHVKQKVALGFELRGEEQLKNIAEPVSVFRVRLEGAPAKPLPPLPDKPSIAVLPFDNMSGDVGQQYLSDGITEDIITELSRFREISVVARHASFQYGGKGTSIAQAARDLGVRYVVEGSVRKSSERLRITAQLIDAKSGNHIWAERYDRDSKDIFAVQDEVVSAIAATLAGRTVAAAAELARRQPTASWSAYDCLLQGRELCNYYRERDAVPFFVRATEVDPTFAQAHSWLALALAVTSVLEAQPQLLNEAAQAAQRALALDANDSTAHWANAMVLMYRREHEQAGVHFDRAIALNPADLQIRADRAAWLRFTGRLEEALAAIDIALKAGPLSPQWFWAWRGEILFDLKRYREAIEAFNGVSQKSHFCYSYMAAAHVYLGDEVSALQTVTKAQEMRPTLSIRELTIVTPHVEKKALNHLLDGLRKAGLPE